MPILCIPPHFLSTLSLVFGRWLVLLRKIQLLPTCHFSGLQYIQILSIHGKTLFNLALQMFLARRQHPYIIAKLVKTHISRNMILKHDYIVRLASVFCLASIKHRRCILLLSKA
jgi:hypothetical protein